MLFIQAVTSISDTETTGRYHAIAPRFTPTAFLAALVRWSGDESQPVFLVVVHQGGIYNGISLYCPRSCYVGQTNSADGETSACAISLEKYVECLLFREEAIGRRPI